MFTNRFFDVSIFSSPFSYIEFALRKIRRRREKKPLVEQKLQTRIHGVQWNFTPNHMARPFHCNTGTVAKMEKNNSPEEDLTKDSLSSLPVKCNAVGCIGSNQLETSLCTANNCAKFVHKECHDGLLNRHNITPLTDPLTFKPLFVCSKTCYNKVKKTILQQPNSRIPWDKDGQDGPDDPNHSLRILLDWILKSNYCTFCRGMEAKGLRKIDYGKSLSLQMKDAGCRVPRLADAVAKKIQDLGMKFVQANDWANNTGQGVCEQDGQETFENLVRQK